MSSVAQTPMLSLCSFLKSISSSSGPNINFNELISVKYEEQNMNIWRYSDHAENCKVTLHIFHKVNNTCY